MLVLLPSLLVSAAAETSVTCFVTVTSGVTRVTSVTLFVSLCRGVTSVTLYALIVSQDLDHCHRHGEVPEAAGIHDAPGAVDLSDHTGVPAKADLHADAQLVLGLLVLILAYGLEDLVGMFIYHAYLLEAEVRKGSEDIVKGCHG